MKTRAHSTRNKSTPTLRDLLKSTHKDNARIDAKIKKCMETSPPMSIQSAFATILASELTNSELDLPPPRPSLMSTLTLAIDSSPETLANDLVSATAASSPSKIFTLILALVKEIANTFTTSSCPEIQYLASIIDQNFNVSLDQDPSPVSDLASLLTKAFISSTPHPKRRENNLK